MRYKSKRTQGYVVFAVTGVNTVSFAIDASKADTAGLLGFAVERVDPAADERYFMQGYKVFRSLIPYPEPNAAVSTFEHPVQSFVWDDFTAKPDTVYEYLFHPVKGQPRNLDRGQPVSLRLRTEPLFSKQTHDVFFNRGVASSQAYTRRFGNRRPDKMKPAQRKAAEEWLSRKLDDAIYAFIDNARKGDTLLCCFYEFRYAGVAERLKAALNRGVKVRLIVDGKKNEYTDKKGVFHESFPREDNIRTIADAKIPKAAVLYREARKNVIQHNKFMVLLESAAKTPNEVWTGSTNISAGGIFGQTNVGHWIRDTATAASFRDYWDLLAGDPGAHEGDDKSTTLKENAALRESVQGLLDTPTSLDGIAQGITPVFSPRKGLGVLEMYANLVDEAEHLACITLAFGIGKQFKDVLKDNTPQGPLVFMLLEKKDAPNKSSKQPFIAINSKNNVYKAWGSYLKEAMHQWARETSTRALQLNEHVAFIHSKFLLHDPLGDDPLVVTGSANFSEPSTNDNDENMVLIRGDARVADIYFTEFNRLFNHYYFRSVTEVMQSGTATANDEDSLFLKESDAWLAKYLPGTLRAKRVEAYARMKGISPEP